MRIGAPSGPGARLAFVLDIQDKAAELAEKFRIAAEPAAGCGAADGALDGRRRRSRLPLRLHDRDVEHLAARQDRDAHLHLRPARAPCPERWPCRGFYRGCARDSCRSPRARACVAASAAALASASASASARAFASALAPWFGRGLRLALPSLSCSFLPPRAFCCSCVAPSSPAPSSPAPSSRVPSSRVPSSPRWRDRASAARAWGRPWAAPASAVPAWVPASAARASAPAWAARAGAAPARPSAPRRPCPAAACPRAPPAAAASGGSASVTPKTMSAKNAACTAIARRTERILPGWRGRSCAASGPSRGPLWRRAREQAHALHLPLLQDVHHLEDLLVAHVPVAGDHHRLLRRWPAAPARTISRSCGALHEQLVRASASGPRRRARRWRARAPPAAPPPGRAWRPPAAGRSARD